jgi:cyclophilin family peptidyl-prolyl cis-trans isomerase/protein-disulfide isomerase
MRKLVLPVLLALALLISACGPAKTQSATSPTTAPASASATQVSPTPTTAPYTDDKAPCKPLNILDFMLPTLKATVAEVTSTDHIKGASNAPITLMLYTDLQCPFCAQADPIFNAVAKAYPNDVRLVFRHWPLTSLHDKAVQAAEAAEAAGRQGKFFEMTEFLFTNQAEWSGKSAADFTSWLNGKVSTLGLNAANFATDWKDSAIVQKVNTDLAVSNQLFGELSKAMPEAGGFGTPTLFINNYLFVAQQRTVESISLIINLLKSNKANTLECPATTIDASKDYFATLTTNKGDIVIDLLEKVAPTSVNSFVNLAQKGWFNNNIFFANDQIVLSGDKSNTGYGGPGYATKDEINPAYTFDKEGMVGLPNFGPGTNGSQFFINKAAFSAINGRYSIFGTVTKGMEVVKSLVSYDETKPVDTADKILSVVISTK